MITIMFHVKRPTEMRTHSIDQTANRNGEPLIYMLTSPRIPSHPSPLPSPYILYILYIPFPFHPIPFPNYSHSLPHTHSPFPLYFPLTLSLILPLFLPYTFPQSITHHPNPIPTQLSTLPHITPCNPLYGLVCCLSPLIVSCAL